MYHLWSQRNAIIHARGFYTKEQLIRVIKKDVQGRIEGQMFLKDSILNCVLCCRLGDQILPCYTEAQLVLIEYL